jgi:uncharacterized membrane protein YphA (DoxX/SURF4 family)
MSKGIKLAVSAISILLAAMFVFSGAFKLMKPVEAQAGFVHDGYAAWSVIFIGVCDLLGALGLLIPRLAALAAAGLGIIMIGAAYTHFSHQEYQHGIIQCWDC